jgi:hypothetical protein
VNEPAEEWTDAEIADGFPLEEVRPTQVVPVPVEWAVENEAWGGAAIIAAGTELWRVSAIGRKGAFDVTISGTFDRGQLTEVRDALTHLLIATSNS